MLLRGGIWVERNPKYPSKDFNNCQAPTILGQGVAFENCMDPKRVHQ